MSELSKNAREDYHKRGLAHGECVRGVHSPFRPYNELYKRALSFTQCGPGTMEGMRVFWDAFVSHWEKWR